MDVAEDTDRESSAIKTDDTSLSNIIESTGDDEALKLLSCKRTFSQDDLDTALLSACHHGYKFLAYELVRKGADVQSRDRNGNTPLLICAEKGFTNMAKLFIRGQAEINAANNCGSTALILATGRSGSVEMVKLLLAHPEIDVNHQNKEGYTASMKAVEALDVDVIILLLDSQKNAAEALHKIKNYRNETAQNIADRLGLGKLVGLLSDPECEPLTEAVLACDVDAFNILISCQFYDSSKMGTTVNNAFKEIIRKHEKSNDSFNADEEQIIKRLLVMLQHGENVRDHFCYYSPDPILTATRVGSYKVLQLLLEHVGSLEKSFHSRNLNYLKVAAEEGRTDLIELLLKYSDVSNLQYSLVECAIENGHIDCARFLLRQGVNVDMETALRHAFYSQNPGYMKFLTEMFQTRVKQLAHTKEIDNLLVSACKYGNIEIIGLLLDSGANVNCVNDYDHKTPLMESRNAEVVYYLVQKGAVVNRYSKAKRSFSSPLTSILSEYYNGCHESDTKEALVEALLKCGACVNSKSNSGRTPLMIAISNGDSTNIVQMLLNYGAQCNLRDSNGNTPLLLAAAANRTKIILCLLKFSGNNKSIVNARNYDGLTALSMASKKCNIEAITHLVDHGADVNIPDVSGNIALHHAVANIDDTEEEILTALISAGSDINHQNNAKISPLMLAREKRKPNFVRLLLGRC